jgi:hypothetical protein
MRCWRPIAACCWFLALPLLAAPAGPTLHFDYSGSPAAAEPSLSKFMYFVPLICPEKVCLSTNAGNTQRARVLSCRCRTNGAAFHADCEFAFAGDGLERNEFDHAFVIGHRQPELKAGKTLAHQLAAINVQGGGLGSIEVDGELTNGQPTVTVVSIHFNGHGHTSPVFVDLQDMTMRNGTMHFENETIARVNTLTFRQKADPPKMEVTLASVKRKDAGNGAWANFVAGVKGAAANWLLPPLTITTDGNRVILDFGLALALRRPTFTFPFASRLTNGPAFAL